MPNISLSDLLTHSWFYSMLFALPSYQYPYIVMNRCLRLPLLHFLYWQYMSYTCWFLWHVNYIENFKWRLHFLVGVAFWKVVLREIYFEGPICVWRVLKTSILNTVCIQVRACSQPSLTAAAAASAPLPLQPPASLFRVCVLEMIVYINLRSICQASACHRFILWSGRTGS
jgi:hypothetical protein